MLGILHGQPLRDCRVAAIDACRVRETCSELGYDRDDEAPTERQATSRLDTLVGRHAALLLVRA